MSKAKTKASKPKQPDTLEAKAETDAVETTHEPLAGAPGMKRLWRWVAVAAAAIVAMPVLFIGYLYAASPQEIRKPTLDHYHFRMQVIVNGEAADFGQKVFQQHYAKDQCSAELPDQPIHFHDEKDQITHIHWDGMTGGLVLKNYGWNLIGGLTEMLGYRFDEDFLRPQGIKIHGNHLSELPRDATLYVYTGDQDSYQKRELNDWLTQDLEDFFGTKSNFPGQSAAKRNWLVDWLMPTAQAHNGVPHDTDAEADTHSAQIGDETLEQGLTRINNLIGNVVILAQSVEPTQEQIESRFDKLEPLSDGTCGG